jgi:hypothetical protein
MAIKGKSKSRGGGKSVTRGPKPAFVPVKTPLYARRSFWIVSGVIVAVAVIGGLWYGFAKQRSKDRDEALVKAMATTMTTFQGDVDPILATVGQATQPTTFSAFPGFEQSVAAFADGSGTPEDLQAAAEGTVTQARKAVASLQKIDVVELVRDKGFDQPFVTSMLYAQANMALGLRLYEQAALLAQDALAAEGDAQAELVARTQSVLELARQAFGNGYQNYIEAQAQAGTLQATQPAGLTGGLLTGPTGG